MAGHCGATVCAFFFCVGGTSSNIIILISMPRWQCLLVKDLNSTHLPTTTAHFSILPLSQWLRWNPLQPQRPVQSKPLLGMKLKLRIPQRPVQSKHRWNRCHNLRQWNLRLVSRREEFVKLTMWAIPSPSAAFQITFVWTRDVFFLQILPRQCPRQCQRRRCHPMPHRWNRRRNLRR